MIGWSAQGRLVKLRGKGTREPKRSDDDTGCSRDALLQQIRTLSPVSTAHQLHVTALLTLYNCVVGRCARGVLKKLLTVTGQRSNSSGTTQHNGRRHESRASADLNRRRRTTQVITRKSLKVLIFCTHSSVATQDILDLVHPPVTRRSCRSRRRQRGHIAQAAHPPSRRGAPARARHRGRFAVLLILVLKVFSAVRLFVLFLRLRSRRTTTRPEHVRCRGPGAARRSATGGAGAGASALVSEAAAWRHGRRRRVRPCAPSNKPHVSPSV